MLRTTIAFASLLVSCAHTPAAKPTAEPPAPAKDLAPLATNTATSPVSAPDVPAGEVLPLVGTFRVVRYTMPNGLRLLVVENHSSPTFAYQTWFKVGSRDEVPGRTGLAHLFEHMMFKETGRLKSGEYMRLLEMAGAEGTNAFTSNDYTTYVQELPSDKLSLITDLEANRMNDLRVDAKAFKTETDVVQNERRLRNENSPDGTMWQELEGTAFTKHSYRWPVIGYQEDLDRMTAQDALDFYRAHYAPNQATVVVVGDVAPVDVYRAVNKTYGKLAAQTPPAVAIEAEPAQDSARHKLLPLNIQVEKMLMGYHAPNVNADDVAPLEVLAEVLAGGKSSRLYRALVDTGIANSASADNEQSKDPHLFVIAVTLQKNRKAAQAERVVLNEINRLVHGRIGPRELERARNRLNFGFYRSLDSNREMARWIGRLETVAGTFERGVAIHDRIQTVTGEDVQRVARQYLQESNRSVVTGVPK